MNVINKLDDATGLTDPEDYHKDAFVHQLDRDGSILSSYKFWDIFPTNISTIDLNYETTDTLSKSLMLKCKFTGGKHLKSPSSSAGGEEYQINS